MRSALSSKSPLFLVTPSFIKEYHVATSTWQKVQLKNHQKEIEPFKNELGFELVAKALGIPKPIKKRG